MDDEESDRFFHLMSHLMSLLGEVPTDTLAKKARAMFPGLVDDPAQRAAFRECLRFMAKARRQVPLTPRDVADLNALAQASYVVEVEGETVGVSEPLPERTVEDVLSESERTVEDVLSESAVDLKAADAAEALAAAFEERS